MKLRALSLPMHSSKINVDFIVLSPGIDIKKCKISSYLIKNRSKIISELDIFEISYPNIDKITITGTNGKSTTSKLLYEVLKNNKKDVRLTGNIGYPILIEKKIEHRLLFDPGHGLEERLLKEQFE